MPSLNNTRLFNGTTVNNEESLRIRVQATREETIGFFFFISPQGSGTTVEIRVAPDDQAAALTTPNGYAIHTIITSGTAGAGTTKTTGAGYALVFLQAMPIMWLRFRNSLSPADACWAWIVE